MTAQVPETLLYNGESLAMCVEPLEVWFKLVGQDESPFEAMSSANWRGYIGTWEIKDSRLYLVGLRGTLKNGEDGSIETFFPGFQDRAFAHWFSGRIRAPRGKLLKYVHTAYASQYEQDVVFHVDRGIIQSINVRENGEAEDGADDGGYHIGGATMFSRRNANGAKRQ
ncbi:hypothetical protein FHP25_32560 [Vineibacter terrae]|uniref:Uncharacterized protein n=1 Tax=Vineibacter terrae TaxID=2586908 RepID=A0A5C8PBN7_9HYPH|nr:hypothetical protein [Vineibacter terrae]TXL70855.1 hypothetical protein FHP25_32560 [Vineibacter terrae]